ncbi:MAG: hypothetical protein Q8P60_01305 [Pseudorhodobacter sp.]|nr:hypothetical protein [Pseudorhodobacter sp.]
MIVIAGLVLGAVIGAGIAARRGGRLPDMAQYAAGYAIAIGLLGLFVTIWLERIL